MMQRQSQPGPIIVRGRRLGTGGVGKTTVAVSLALELARRGHRVHLTTTDPAAHVADALGAPVEGIRVSRIDPAVETRSSRFPS